MKDVIDLVTGYFTLRKLQRGGFIKDDEFNLSFTEFIICSIKAIKQLEKEETEKGGEQ